MKDNHVLLFSGGIDSFVAYHYLRQVLKQDITPVYFDLGAPYNPREIRVVKSLLPTTIIDTSLKIGDTQRGQNAFIPYRNLLLACLARKYGNHIWIAGLKDDCVEDKNPQAFNFMDSCMNFISKPEDRVYLRSPFWDFTKEEVVSWWVKNAPGNKDIILQTISCYDPYESTNYCGRCPSCLRKFFALRNNGFQIEFYNQKLFDQYIERAELRVYNEQRCESILNQKGYQCKKIYNVDIDGILTKDTDGHDYLTRIPARINIDVVNSLHDAGHKIVLFTSRYGTIEDKETTSEWLKMNGVKYDAILYNKPYCDYNIDDKNMQCWRTEE